VSDLQRCIAEGLCPVGDGDFEDDDDSSRGDDGAFDATLDGQGGVSGGGGDGGATALTGRPMAAGELRGRWEELSSLAVAAAAARATGTIAGARAAESLRTPLVALFAQAEAWRDAVGGGEPTTLMDEITKSYVSLGLCDDDGDGGACAADSAAAAHSSPHSPPAPLAASAAGSRAGAGALTPIPAGSGTLVGFVVAHNAAARGVMTKRVMVSGSLPQQW
jgi:hypothetical protein